MDTTLIRKIVLYFKPVVRLTPMGKKMLNGGKPRRGRLWSITSNGTLRVRKFGQKTIGNYAPGFWEFCDQDDERVGDQ